MGDKNSIKSKGKMEQRKNIALMKSLDKAKNRKKIPKSEYVTEMKNKDNILEIDNLATYFFTDSGVVKAVNGVSFDIPRGKTVAVVGESGCGKSITSMSIMRLIQGPSGQIVDGQIRYNSEEGPINLVNVPISKMQELRGNKISMIFQEPMTSLNPVFTVGDQIDEAIQLHNPKLTAKQIKTRSIEMLELVGIARPEGIYDAYPHELSGGMRQRVMIGMALSCEPELIIADEPTTALDVTIQAQILELLREIKDKVNASILLITHDLGVVAEMADYVVVMYAGRIIEKGTAIDIYKNPQHPYTIGLLNSKPAVGKVVDKLYSIPGQVPNPINMPSHCYFKDRCEKSFEPCGAIYFKLRIFANTFR
ncbi:MAG: oligopeptide/dipeptide transporter, ATPase subunit [Clostridiales bacterium]|nr:oligopeptide/dipeptide transporter, ATPase subunit [Clostridiales bacterium]